MSSKIDSDIVELLKISKEKVGFLNPVVVDQDGNILSGRHRKYADANWTTIVKEVKDDLERELLILHYNIQRSIPKEETQSRLMRIAKLLESSGCPNENISSTITKMTGFSRTYVAELLPEEYKMMSKARDFGKPVDQKEVERWELEYFGVPLVPEKLMDVEKAIELAKKKWNTEDKGEALWHICKGFMESFQ